MTGDAKYVNAVAEGMNYILGRNPLDQSYITGYGERPLKNPHHRFWAHQANAKFPSPPPGVVSGGPNSGLQDPVRPGGRAAGLRAAEVLRRQHRGLVGQRDGDQLERAARLGGGLPRREGERRGRPPRRSSTPSLPALSPTLSRKRSPLVTGEGLDGAGGGSDLF